MALLFLDSFDHYQTEELDKKWTGTNGDLGIEAGKGRCGTAALRMGTFADAIRGIAFGSNTPIVGFAFRINSEMTSPTLGVSLLYLRDGQGRNYLGIGTGSDGSVVVFAPEGTSVSWQTAPNLIHHDTWYFVELKVLLHMSAGAITLRINNVEHLNVSGVQTMGEWGDGSAYNTLPPRAIYLIGTSNQEHWVDDLYVSDDTGPAPQHDFLGDVRVEYLRPRAAGAHQAWPVVVGSSGSHWLAVRDDAIPDGDGSYVEANAPGLTDTNLYEPTGLPTGNPIFGAQLSLYARKTEIGPRTIAPMVNGVTGTPHGPSFESYQYYSTSYGANPATGAAWTVASINAIDAGVTVVT
jgi:hypothetical protein